jgi:hypothetical protein
LNPSSISFMFAESRYSSIMFFNYGCKGKKPCEMNRWLK